MSKSYKFIQLVLFFLSMQIAAMPAVDKIPVEAFASLPDVSNVKLSPNGNLVASLVKVDLKDKKGTTISITNLQNGAKEYPLFADNITLTFDSFEWASNDILLVKASYPETRYGVATTETRMLMYNLNSKKSQNILSNRYLGRLTYVPNILSNIIDYLPEDKEHILLSLPGFNRTGEPTVVKVSLDRNGKTQIYKGIEHDVWNWITDAQHNVRIAIYRKDTHYRIYEHQIDDKDKRRLLWEFDAFSNNQIWPLGFDLDPQLLYVRALHKGLNAVYKVNLTNPALNKELVYFDDEYDVDGALRRSPKTKKVIGIGSIFWDESYRKIQKDLDKVMPANDNYILNFSEDENRYIALTTSDTEPGIYLIGDRNKNTLNALAYRYSKLTPEILNDKKLISYKARDGLEIEGYLTLPKTTSKRNLPTVIFPHGGPISFDGDGFDYWTQFLASRGYAVLQMNFRGSHGYGFDFMNMGVGNWGKAMQDDIEDGTRWLIEKGYSNPDSICILGASYGGYAALMGVIKTPKLYKCAVSFAGVTDLQALKNAQRAYIGHEVSDKQIGDDYGELRERSPLNYAEKINVPVLLIHGNKDRIVKVEQSEDMYNKLLHKHKKVEYIELDKGDHHLSNSEHRLIAFKAIERFLAENLTVR